LTCDDVENREGQMVKVRLFAALREIAGATEVEAEGLSAGDIVDVLSSRCGERFSQIAAVGSVVVNGERATRATPVAAGDEVALLPPVSGGSPMRNSRR
jgi:MoaE-MoaD fusion protein